MKANTSSHRDLFIHYRKIASHFSKAATQYETEAQLQRHVGFELLSILNKELLPKSILDLGCSTAYFSTALKELYPQAALYALDISESMLTQASTKKPTHLICANMEMLPFAKQEFDLIFANMCLQWSSKLDENFAELRRVITPQGRLLFSVPGPQTLIELKKSWQAVDHFSHVNAFPTICSIEQQLDKAGFKHIALRQKNHTLEYPSVIALMQHLKKTGTGYVCERQKGLTGKNKFKKMLAHYETYRGNNALLPCTYEIIFGEAY